MVVQTVGDADTLVAATSAASAVPRRVALCVFSWSSTTTVVAWAWLRQYFLRQSLDTLYIIHTGSKEDWDQAGPLTPGLHESLAGWDYKIFSFSGSLQSNIVGFLTENDVNLVLVGEDFPRGGRFLAKNNPLTASPAEWVKSHVDVPFMIIRQDSVLRLRGLRISDSDMSLSPVSPKSPSRNCSSARRIAVAYSDEDVGRKMLKLARKMVLLPKDEVYMVHCSPNHGNVGNVVGGQLVKMRSQLSRIGKRVGGGSSPTRRSRGGSTDGELDLDVSVSHDVTKFGPDVTKTVVLKGGDPRSLISDFCASKSVDLLIISSRSAGRLRKTITGGSVSSYLINNVACPSLVIPLKILGYSANEELGRSFTLTAEGLNAVDDDLEAMDAPQLRALVRRLRAELDELRVQVPRGT